jgi:hypothetical protein
MKYNKSQWFEAEYIPVELIPNHERFRVVLKKICNEGDSSNEPIKFIEQGKSFDENFSN